MKTFQQLLIAGVAVLALGGIAPSAGAAASTGKFLVSAVVLMSCRVTQDHDHPSVANSFCTNGAEFTSQAVSTQVGVINRTASDVEITF